MDALLDQVSPAFASAFEFAGSRVTWLEILAFVLALVMVFFNMRVDARGWPLAIISSLLYFLVFWKSRLYGDASLQLFFAAIAVWGWRQWLRGATPGVAKLEVRELGAKGRLLALLAIAIAWPAVALFLDRFSDTDVPWWDAFPTAASVVAQWLLGRKYIENWPAWVAVNVVGVLLFAYKGLWLTVLLYAIFVVLSFAGWRLWRARLRASTRPA